MTFLEWIEFMGPLDIFSNCCVKPIGAIVLILGIVWVRQNDVEDLSQRPMLWAGACAIVGGVLMILF